MLKKKLGNHAHGNGVNKKYRDEMSVKLQLTSVTSFPRCLFRKSYMCMIRIVGFYLMVFNKLWMNECIAFSVSNSLN